MIDGRKAGAELCETSRLALHLARLGQGAGLHHTPLFSRPFLGGNAGSGGRLGECAGPSGAYGKPPPAKGRATAAKGDASAGHDGPAVMTGLQD